MREKSGSRKLEIDGETVVFEINVAGSVASVGEGGRIPTPRPFLGYRVVRNGERVREGVLADDVQYPGNVADQYADQELIDLYRKARQR